MSDKFARFYTNIDGPYSSGFPITSNNDTTFAQPTRGIYVGTTGNVHVRFLGNQANGLFVAVPAGTELRVRVDKVWSTSTTANNLLGLF